MNIDLLNDCIIANSKIEQNFLNFKYSNPDFKFNLHDQINIKSNLRNSNKIFIDGLTDNNLIQLNYNKHAVYIDIIDLIELFELNHRKMKKIKKSMKCDNPLKFI